MSWETAVRYPTEYISKYGPIHGEMRATANLHAAIIQADPRYAITDRYRELHALHKQVVGEKKQRIGWWITAGLAWPAAWGNPIENGCTDTSIFTTFAEGVERMMAFEWVKEGLATIECFGKDGTWKHPHFHAVIITGHAKSRIMQDLERVFSTARGIPIPENQYKFKPIFEGEEDNRMAYAMKWNYESQRATEQAWRDWLGIPQVFLKSWDKSWIE